MISPALSQGCEGALEGDRMYKTKAAEVCSCDCCGRPVANFIRCPGCGRRPCAYCGERMTRDPWTGGLAIQRVCKPCAAMLEPLAKQAAEIRSEAEVRIDRLRALWERRCKQNMEVKDA